MVLWKIPAGTASVPGAGRYTKMREKQSVPFSDLRNVRRFTSDCGAKGKACGSLPWTPDQPKKAREAKQMILEGIRRSRKKEKFSKFLLFA